MAFLFVDPLFKPLYKNGRDIIPDRGSGMSAFGQQKNNNYYYPCTMHAKSLSLWHKRIKHMLDNAERSLKSKPKAQPSLMKCSFMRFRTSFTCLALLKYIDMIRYPKLVWEVAFSIMIMPGEMYRISPAVM